MDRERDRQREKGKRVRREIWGKRDRQGEERQMWGKRKKDRKEGAALGATGPSQATSDERGQGHRS